MLMMVVKITGNLVKGEIYMSLEDDPLLFIVNWFKTKKIINILKCVKVLLINSI